MLNEALARALVAERLAAAERVHALRRWDEPKATKTAKTRRWLRLRLQARARVGGRTQSAAGESG